MDQPENLLSFNDRCHGRVRKEMRGTVRRLDLGQIWSR